MSNLPEQIAWESGIHQLEETDRAKAGPGGVLNIQANQLANRTKWLRAQIESAQDYREYTFYKSESDPDGTIAGLANTPSGKMFRVAQGLNDDLAFIYYLNDSGAALALTALLGRGAITNNVREYSTLPLAQNDLDAGNILDAAKCWVTNSADATLADEYINNGGALTATGRRMPSQAAVEAVSESLMLQIDDIGDRQIEIQRKIDGFSSSVFDSSANDLLIALTDALGRRTWLEADLRGRPSPYSVRLLREVLPDLLTGILFDSERYGLSAAITDSAGRRTWLEADMEGKPSARSAELIGGVIADYLPQSLIDALVDLLAPLISGE
ncbi:TPA: hypothetical protein N3503_001498, partial [Klebsiella pneumoniae]|nr:hypothetical protein [Klebsiella pneumoniae]